MNVLNTGLKKLHYEVHSVSSYSTAYLPENILENSPHNQASRWSSDSNTPPQYITLKLMRPAIVKTITFGKYEKTHVCNLRKFKIFGGMDDHNMVELFDGGLQNDAIPETFPLRFTFSTGDCFPIVYIKIVPLMSWGPSFNFSIWYLELHGTDEEDYVQASMENFNSFREKEVIRLCLKHFRQNKYDSAFLSLQSQTGVKLEDPFITKLYDTLVVNGDYIEAESIMESAIRNGLMAQYVSRQEYRASWTPLTPHTSNQDNKSNQPGMRGGHQMVIDPYTDTVFLFGGWDGDQDLSDLWAYHVPTNSWSLICRQTETVGGPSPRSCHKMCLDPERRQIFTLGRYLDTTNRVADDLKKDFYVYDIENGTWTLITEDTSSMGGPHLTFDHHMCIDTAKRTLYVFGGRILPYDVTEDVPQLNNGTVEPQYSGLYSYHIPTNTWKQLLPDCNEQILSHNITGIRSRVAHSMLFHPGCRKLFIYGGQRNKEYLNHILSYAVDTGEINVVCDMLQEEPKKVPPAGYTQRATLDPELNELYILSGLSKEKEKRDEDIQHSFWVYNISQNSWTCVYKNENTGDVYWNKMANVEPCPRFAHQLVYDHINKVHYLFGGNPGKAVLPKLRLDDFWLLRLLRPSHEELLQQCKLVLRKHKFGEMAVQDNLAALRYLQNDLYNIIDHQDKVQIQQFHQLTSSLFCNDNYFSNLTYPLMQNKSEAEQTLEPIPGPSHSSDNLTVSRYNENSISENSLQMKLHLKRSLLFNKLMEFFPDNMVQPKSNLSDLVLL